MHPRRHTHAQTTSHAAAVTLLAQFRSQNPLDWGQKPDAHTLCPNIVMVYLYKTFFFFFLVFIMKTDSEISITHSSELSEGSLDFSTGMSEDYMSLSTTAVSAVHTSTHRTSRQLSVVPASLGWGHSVLCSTGRWHMLYNRLRGSPVAIMVQACECERLEAGKHNTTHVSHWVHVQDIWGCQRWLVWYLLYVVIILLRIKRLILMACPPRVKMQRNFPPCQVMITSKC